jgi:hypothetical protein
MTDKFDGVPTEKDTKILFRHQVKFGDYDVLYEKWTWDGITAESVIFDNNDVAELSDEEIKDDVKSSPLVQSDSDVTIKRSETGYTFVNFNFKS